MSGAEVSRIRVGMANTWAPMLGQYVPDCNTGIDLVLLDDGTVRWEEPVRPGRSAGAS